MDKAHNGLELAVHPTVETRPAANSGAAMTTGAPVENDVNASAVYAAPGIDFHWDVRKLWAAALPVVDLDVADLAWLLDLPFWTVRGRSNVRPLEVATGPDGFADEYARVMRSDLQYPINVIWLQGRWVTLDGLHRLLKAHILGHVPITAKTAYRDDLPLFRRRADEPHNHP